MKFKFIIFLFFVASSIFAQQKMVAITIDDLPFVRSRLFNREQLMEKTDKLLSSLKAEGAEATGFVNFSQVYKSGEFDSSIYKVLKLWPEKGFDLGNHTFSHPDYNHVSYRYFISDIEKNDPFLHSLLDEYQKPVVYFRHPFLHRGDSKSKADSLAVYLKDRNIIEAPVTVDNAEWIFAAAYDSVLQTGNSHLAEQVGTMYINYMESKVRFYEGISEKLFSRNIRHILLIHANSLNADYMGELLKMFIRNGYSFVDLVTALEDELYKTEDHFYFTGGVSWLNRWAYTQGKGRDFFSGEPECPKEIMKLAKVDSE